MVANRTANGVITAWPTALAGGISIGLAAVVLLRISMLWMALLTVGLTVLVGSLLMRNARIYWLVIFALVLPLEIKKMLVNSESVVEFVRQYGFPTGELPGPVLYLSDLPLLVLLLFWGWDILMRKQPIHFPKANWILLSLIGWSALSIFNASDWTSATFDLVRAVKLYVLYLFAYNQLGDRQLVKWLFIALMAGMVLQGVLCVTQFISQDMGRLFTTLLGKKDMYGGDLKSTVQDVLRISEGGIGGKRGSGTVGPINAEAFYFELLLPIAFLIGLTVKHTVEKTWAMIASVAGLLGLVATFSRGGMIGLLGGVAALLTIAWVKAIVPRQQIIMLVVCFLLLLAAVLPLLIQYFVTRPEGASARIHLLKVGLEMVREHPLLGVGLNNHLQAKLHYDPRIYPFQMCTHNHFVLLASQIGIPGLLFFLAFLWSIWQSAWKAVKSTDPLLRAVAGGVGAVLVSIFLHSQFDIIGTHTNLTLVWLFGGLVGALARQVEGAGQGLLPELISRGIIGHG